MAGLSVTIRVMAGDPVTGLWCETCALPSVISVPVYLLSNSGVTLHGHALKCADCGLATFDRHGRRPA
jgi:hypothetical protein